jgi:hypothetical protein
MAEQDRDGVTDRALRKSKQHKKALQENRRAFIFQIHLQIQGTFQESIKKDGLVKSPQCRHCEERSDAAISVFQADTNYEIASPSVRNDGEGPQAKTAFQTYYEYIN